MANFENICYAACLPGELWSSIFKYFHPVYDDLFTISLVCQKWRTLIVTDPDPSLWEYIEVCNVRNCYPDSPLLTRFNLILGRFGKCIKVLKLHRCHEYFTDVLRVNSQRLSALQVLEISGMYWDKKILRQLPCCKTLRSVVLEAFNTGESNVFMEQDLRRLVDNFPRIDTISLQYSVIKAETLIVIQDLAVSSYGGRITDLHLERAKIGPYELNDIICGLQGLTKFSYGNDQIYGLPSIQHLFLESESILEVNLFQIGDFSELSFKLPNLQKMTLNISTSVQNLSIDAPFMRCLHLLHCVELRQLRKISSNSLRELKLRRCSALCSAELIAFLVQNPDIKNLELEMYSVSLRLDQHSNPSLEKLVVFDSGDMLTSIDIRCPKLRTMTFKKSLLRSSLLKSVALIAEEMDLVVIQDVPHLRKMNINAEKVGYLEADFDRRIGQIKPMDFTKISLAPNIVIKKLLLKKCNIQSIALKKCKVSHVILKSCNLDASLSDLLSQCNNVQCLSLQRCYGPCQLTLQNHHLKELFVESCSTILMEHLNVTCPALERLCIFGCSFLPSQKEIEMTANDLKQICPMLQSIKFSQ